MKHHKQASLIAVVHSIKLPTLSKAGKTSLVFHLPMGGHGFDQWSGKTLPAEELLSPWTKTTEPALWSPQATTTRSPQTGTREYSSLAATRESPCSNEDPANKSIFKKQKQTKKKKTEKSLLLGWKLRGRNVSSLIQILLCNSHLIFDN